MPIHEHAPRAERFAVDLPVYLMEKEMKKSVSVAVLWAACAVPAFADCTRPSAPTSFPDGKSAAMDEMMAAKKTVDAFKKGMEEYISCEKSTPKANAAIAELEKV